MSSTLAIFGAGALGVVMGWLIVLICRLSRSASVAMNLRAMTFTLPAAVSTVFVAWSYVDLLGILAASVGLGLGACAAVVVRGSISEQERKR